ncbi:MAG: LysR family transcriptional regulator [Thiolinea sp.]
METLTLRKLKVLVAVAETGSATQAGQLLHLGQSAVSQTIKELQTDLGITLFERMGRGLVATPDGHRLAAEGQRVLAALKRANSVATALQRGEPGELAVGVLTPFIHGEIARCIARFSAQHTPLSLALESHKKPRLVEHVLHGDLDIAVAIGGVNEPGITTFATISMRVVCIASPNHPLANLSVVHDSELKQYRQIMLTEGSPLRVALEAAGVGGNSDPQRGMIKVSTQRAIVTMVETGAGVALVDPLVLSPDDQVVVLPYEPAVNVNLCMFARDDWQERPHVRDLALQLYESLLPLASDSSVHV